MAPFIVSISVSLTVNTPSKCMTRHTRRSVLRHASMRRKRNALMTATTRTAFATEHPDPIATRISSTATAFRSTSVVLLQQLVTTSEVVLIIMKRTCYIFQVSYLFYFILKSHGKSIANTMQLKQFDSDDR